jgi:hypothetical protein
MMACRRFAFVAACCWLFGGPVASQAAKVTVDLGDAKGVASVSAIHRWTDTGDPVKLVEKDRTISEIDVTASAKSLGHGKWGFADLKPGRYDLLIMLESKIRIEGFSYPPILDFDPFIPVDATADEEVVSFIVDDIHKSPHYENKVEPIYMGSDKAKKATRVLVQLLRDKKTSYKVGYGTMRHEIWQYDSLYGGWQKNKRTKVLNRIIMPVEELRTWHWLWEPKLGDIQVKKEPLTIKYDVPEKPDPAKLKGLYPY